MGILGGLFGRSGASKEHRSQSLHGVRHDERVTHGLVYRRPGSSDGGELTHIAG